MEEVNEAYQNKNTPRTSYRSVTSNEDDYKGIIIFIPDEMTSNY